jgi:hypothetical protein
MCGILAGSGKLNPCMIAALGCLNAKRGTESAGLAWYQLGGIRVEKTTKHPITAFEIEFHEFVNRAAQSGTLIGHTRTATTGAVTQANAHPFLMEGIAFAHNGIINNYKEFGKYAVDSQSLIHGIKAKDFSKYVGSIALVWIDGNKLFAYRKGNPLFRGMKKGGMYIASEDDFLKEIGCEKIKSLTEGLIYTIGGGEIIKAVQVPENKSFAYTYASESEFYGYYNGGYKGEYEWVNRAIGNAKKSPKPSDNAVCICGHIGEKHESVNTTTGGWMCMEKVEVPNTDSGATLCTCNDFVDKRVEEIKSRANKMELWEEPIPEPLILCECGHSEVAHFPGNNMSCRITNCPCMKLLPVAEVEGSSVAGLLEEGSRMVPDNLALCTCGHEAEYHDSWDACYVMEKGVSCECEKFAFKNRDTASVQEERDLAVVSPPNE